MNGVYLQFKGDLVIKNNHEPHNLVCEGKGCSVTIPSRALGAEKRPMQEEEPLSRKQGLENRDLENDFGQNYGCLSKVPYSCLFQMITFETHLWHWLCTYKLEKEEMFLSIFRPQKERTQAVAEPAGFDIRSEWVSRWTGKFCDEMFCTVVKVKIYRQVCPLSGLLGLPSPGLRNPKRIVWS